MEAMPKIKENGSPVISFVMIIPVFVNEKIVCVKLSGLSGIQAHNKPIKIIMEKFRRQSQPGLGYTIHAVNAVSCLWVSDNGGNITLGFLCFYSDIVIGTVK